MVIDTDTQRAREAEVRQQADTARAFRALLVDPSRLGYTYFIRRWVERGMPRRDAERRFVHLLTDLKDLEAELRLHAGDAGPPGVNKGDTPVDQLVLNDAVSWRRYTGQQPDTSEPSAFVKFCLALASLAELPLNRDRVRRVLQQGPIGCGRERSRFLEETDGLLGLRPRPCALLRDRPPRCGGRPSAALPRLFEPGTVLMHHICAKQKRPEWGVFVWRRRTDSNRRCTFLRACSLSRGVPSTTRPRLR